MFDPRTPDHDDHDDDDDEDGLWAPPRLTHDGVPIHGWHRGEPIPALDRIPKDRCRQVLKPLRDDTRRRARNATQSDVITAGPGEHARLLEAASLFAMTPTTLARVLTVRGVERALYEHRRDA
jgi:hypothetical protein